MKGGQEEAHKFIDNLEIFSLLALEKGFAAAAKETYRFIPH